MKPREFWTDGGMVFDFEEKELADEILINPKPIHVREVIPINWEKVWSKVWEMDWNIDTDIEKIQEFIEKQLRGED